MIKRWRSYFPHHQYDTNYGLSESIGPGCVHLGVDNIEKAGTIGKAGYGWEVKIVDSSGAPVPKGQVGELIVKGPGVMVCYYRDPKATADVLKDGWLYTGDMAQEDEDGFIMLVDRKKDVIISGGENLYPVQIEDFLRTYEPTNAPIRSFLQTFPAIQPARLKSQNSGHFMAAAVWWKRKTGHKTPCFFLS